MKSPLAKKFSIDNDFIVISPEKNVSVEPLDSGLYQQLDKNYNCFVGHELVCCHEFTSDWASWEIHPHGDEIVMLLAGKATLILQLDDGETATTLEKQGDYVVVPRNTWHTAKTEERAKLLFITPGEGTQNK